MLEWFSAGVASAQAAKDITQSLLTLRGEEAVRSRVFDLTQSLMELQQQLMNAQLEQMQLIKRVKELETAVADASEADDQKHMYQLHEFDNHTFAYTLKPEHQVDGPVHYLCSNCFEGGERVTLQMFGGVGFATRKCPRCKTCVSYESRPMPTVRKSTYSFRR